LRLAFWAAAGVGWSMEFEWDGNKAVANLEKHAIDFVDVVDVFEDGRLFVEVDGRFPEPRCRAIGMVEGVVLSVVYTMRGDVCRIISARRASRRERRAYRSL
jgi:hypothetical protein